MATDKCVQFGRCKHCGALSALVICLLTWQRGVKVLGDTLLKMVSVLRPEDVRQMKADGSTEERLKWVEDILHLLDQMAVSWHDGEYGVMSLVDVQLWAEIRQKLKELRAALREG